MKFSDYLDKLRAKPEKERQRIAVIATGVAFSVIFLIWLVSFSEMNKSVEEESNSASVSDQMEELKKNAGEGKQSIQDMMQGFSGDSPAVGGESLNQEPIEMQNEGTIPEGQGQNTDNVQNSQQEIPSLP